MGKQLTATEGFNTDTERERSGVQRYHILRGGKEEESAQIMKRGESFLHSLHFVIPPYIVDPSGRYTAKLSHILSKVRGNQETTTGTITLTSSTIISVK